MRSLLLKYADIIPYAVFGVLTTFVNIAVYWLLAHLLGWSVMASTIAAWFAAVAFAYLTNRRWVFHSDARGIGAVTREMVSFFACRLGTGVLDWLCMFVFVDVLGLDDVVIKTLANVVVILMNYLASKFVIFKHSR